MSSGIYKGRRVLKTNEEIEYISARPAKTYNYSHNVGVDLPLVSISIRLCLTAFSPSFSCISYMHAASGLVSWSMERLAFATRQFAPKIVKLLVRFIRMCSILPSERA